MSTIAHRWSPLVVVPALLRDAQTWRDRGWIVLYFTSRLRLGRLMPFRWLAPRPRPLAFRSNPAPLSVSIQSGGLSTWYEISLLEAYASVVAHRPQAGSVVVDVGANIGVFSLWAAKLIGSSGRLIAIEPNPVSFAHLQRSLRSLTIPVDSLSVACGETETNAVLHFESGFTVSSSLEPFAEADQSASVQVRRLDRILEELGIDHVDMLKIDVEGAEEAVLRGADRILPATDRIAVETTDGEIGANIRSLLTECGFEIVAEEVDHWGVPGLQLIGFRRREIESARVPRAAVE
jgi:FkbM family methyltransferase